MKNQKICPKCGGSDLIMIDGYDGSNGTGNIITTGMSIFSAVPIDRYICCSCGYTEEWINMEDMDKVKKSRKARPHC